MPGYLHSFEWMRTLWPLLKELALEENRHAFRTQVSVETGLKGDSEIDKLQQKIIEQVQHASGS